MSFEARPPYVEFELRTASNGDGEQVETVFAIITPHGSKDRIEVHAEEWLERKRQESRGETPRFPATWVDHFKRRLEAFKEGLQLPELGQAVASCQLFTAAERKAILSAGVRAVEDLAQANEDTLRHIGPGARRLKEIAVRAVSDAGAAEAARVAAESVAADLKARLDAALAELAALKKAPPTTTTQTTGAKP